MGPTTNRPKTGHLLVGGDFHLHVGYGIKNSWLAKEDPSKYLFSASDFGSDADGFGQHFAIPAMNAPFSAFLLDVPMARDNGALKQSQGISVLYLPEEEPWTAARFICVLNWSDDIITRDDKGKTWRQWDSDWFRERVRKELETDEHREREKLSRSQEVLATLGAVQTALQTD